MDTEMFGTFVKTNCMRCGSQRCDPSYPEWREGCLKWQEYERTFTEDQVENSPKTIFISQPMSGLTQEEILKRRAEIEQLVKIFFSNSKVDFIDSFNPNALNNGAPLEELGECIKLLHKADIVIMADNWVNSRGCQCERFVAKQYDKPIFSEKELKIAVKIQGKL